MDIFRAMENWMNIFLKFVGFFVKNRQDLKKWLNEVATIV